MVFGEFSAKILEVVEFLLEIAIEHDVGRSIL
jgi:hypothetical protein